MPDKKLLSQVRAIFFRSKEMIVVLSLFFASIVGAAVWQMTRAISPLYDDAALGALDMPLKFSLASFAVFSFLAFEMSYKLRRYKLDECMNTVAHAKRKIFLAQGVIFVVIILIFFAFFNIWSLLLFISINRGSKRRQYTAYSISVFIMIKSSPQYIFFFIHKYFIDQYIIIAFHILSC